MVLGVKMAEVFEKKPLKTRKKPLESVKMKNSKIGLRHVLSWPLSQNFMKHVWFSMCLILLELFIHLWLWISVTRTIWIMYHFFRRVCPWWWSSSHHQRSNLAIMFSTQAWCSLISGCHRSPRLYSQLSYRSIWWTGEPCFEYMAIFFYIPPSISSMLDSLVIYSNLITN